jgi:hypothetical protein
MENKERKDALYFVMEQACCLAQATGRETDDFRVCQATAEYLTDGSEAAMTDFRARTSAMKRDPDADYDTEQYDGKRGDARQAVSALVMLGTAADTREEKRSLLLKAADLIAAFYGMDGTLEAFPA